MKRTLILIILAAMLATLCGCEFIIQEEDSGVVALPSGKDEYGQWTFDDTVYLGRVVPLTGSLSAFGEGSPFVEEQAIDAINENGGVVLDGKRCLVELITRDSRSSTIVAKQTAQDLIDLGVSMMLVSHTADTVQPVASVCEREGIPCISVDAPTDAWISSGPYDNCWHTHFNTESELSSFLEAWDSIDTNHKIGLVTANDIEGIEMATYVEDFAAAKGYRIIDPGRYTPGALEFSGIVEKLIAEDCDIVLGVMEPQDFISFWRECALEGFSPKVCSVAKACIFTSSVYAIGAAANGLVTEVWWSEDFPYTSSITGQSCHDLADTYRSYAGLGEEDSVPPVIGHKHANVEIAYDILYRAGSLDLDKINVAAAATDLDTIVGHVSFNSDHVSIMNCVTGQWQLDEDGKLVLEIVCNMQLPEIKKTAELIVLPGWGEEDEK